MLHVLFAGFLEFTWQRGDAPFAIVDVSDLAASVGMLRAEALAPLIDRPARLAASGVAAYWALWQRLRDENAPLRVIADGAMRSVPITQHDELVLSCANEEWWSAARVVGTALMADDERSRAAAT